MLVLNQVIAHRHPVARYAFRQPLQQDLPRGGLNPGEVIEEELLTVIRGARIRVFMGSGIRGTDPNIAALRSKRLVVAASGSSLLGDATSVLLYGYRPAAAFEAAEADAGSCSGIRRKST